MDAVLQFRCHFAGVSWLTLFCYGQAYCDPSMEYIQVSFSDICKVLVSLLVVSGTVLTLWTALAPLEWSRTYRENTDIFLRLTDSYGECRGDSAAFAILLVTVNFGILSVGSWQAAVTRHVETEYKESQFINLSLFSILQAWMMGIAILSVTYDDPQARFYVMSGIIFVTSASSLAFVFAPKYLALSDDVRTRGKKAYLERHRSSGKLKAPRDDVDEEKEKRSADAISAASSESSGPMNGGSRVVHNPKVSFYFVILQFQFFISLCSVYVSCFLLQSTRNLIATGGRSLSRKQIHEMNKSQMHMDVGVDRLSERGSYSRCGRFDSSHVIPSVSQGRNRDSIRDVPFEEDSTACFAVPQDEALAMPATPFRWISLATQSTPQPRTRNTVLGGMHDVPHEEENSSAPFLWKSLNAVMPGASQSRTRNAVLDAIPDEPCEEDLSASFVLPQTASRDMAKAPPTVDEEDEKGTSNLDEEDEDNQIASKPGGGTIDGETGSFTIETPRSSNAASSPVKEENGRGNASVPESCLEENWTSENGNQNGNSDSGTGLEATRDACSHNGVASGGGC